MQTLSKSLFYTLFLIIISSKSYAAINLPPVDLQALPLDMGHVTTVTPQANYVYVCSTAPFNAAHRRSPHAGNWIHRDGTFNLQEKPQVEGSVYWPNHHLSIEIRGQQRFISTNDLPSTPTGIFPIQANTLAYQFDHNPNPIIEQSFSIAVPAYPRMAVNATCLPAGGPIGVLLNGVELFNALDAAGRNALAYEIQDHCWGHPQRNGIYHHHSLTPCMSLGDKNGTSPLLGYAMDGFGIYGPYQDGKLLRNQDLDECHGITSTVMWEGKKTKIYHYVANFEYPYTLGCYRGTAKRRPPPTRAPMGRPGI